MSELTFPRFPLFLQSRLPGLLLTAAIAAAAGWLAERPLLSQLGLGALTLAILLGIIVGNSAYDACATRCDAGVLLAKQRLLRLGIVLFGFRITLQQIGEVGASGVLIDSLTLGSTFFLTCLLGIKWLKLDRDLVWLIGAGSSICGAAAILASEPLLNAKPARVAVAIATVVLFGTLGIVLYPLIWRLALSAIPGLSESAFGVYIGSTLHEVAQVVAAGHAVGGEAENSAVIAKMLRVMMLAPFLLCLGSFCGRAQRQKITVPWFAVGFIAVALFNSLQLLPAALLHPLNQLANLLLAMAMAALGLTTRCGALRQAGLKPLLLGLLIFLWLIGGGALINLLIQHFMA